jgi:Protein of unknown function (DUF3277)
MKAANPTRFTISLGGILIQRGFADGEFFTAEPESDAIGSVAGTDGEVAVSVNYDARWTVTIKLLQTSDENLKCSQLYNLKRRSHGAIGFFPFLAKHADTGEYLTATDACFTRAPSLSVDRTATSREWKILLTNADYGFAR